MLNRKKTIAVLICTALTFTTLYGCNININSNLTEDAIEEKEDAAKTDDKQEVTRAFDMAAIPELESVEFNLTEYGEDGDSKIFESYGNSYLCTEESGEEFPELAQALSDIDEVEKDTYRLSIDEYMEDAVEFTKEQIKEGTDYTYFCYNETELKTADDRVVSLLRTEYSFFGGAHPTYGYDTFNIDVKTGEEIRLSDIITDKEGLDGILIDKLNEKYPDGNFFDLEKSLGNFWMDDAPEEEGATIYTFTMGPSGISFYFDPYALNSYADGAQEIDLTYGDLDSILKEGFIYADEKDSEDDKGDMSRSEDDNGEYTDIYLEKASELNDSGDADQFAIIDIDGDGTCEFVASSSEGSWDKDQIFLYTVKDGEAALLVSDIGTGMEGHYIAYFKGKNIIDCSGAAMGERHDYYEIKDGELNEILSLQYFDNPEKDYETVYFVDEKEVDEDEYNKAGKKFFEDIDTMISLDTEEMTEYSVEWADGYADLTLEDTIPYMSLEELQEEYE